MNDETKLCSPRYMLPDFQTVPDNRHPETETPLSWQGLSFCRNLTLVSQGLTKSESLMGANITLSFNFQRMPYLCE